MFKPEQEERYNIFDREKNMWLQCDSHEELLDFLGRTILRFDSWNRKHTVSYSEFDFTGNDFYFGSVVEWKWCSVRDYAAENLRGKSAEYDLANPIYKMVYKKVWVDAKIRRRYLVLNSNNAIVDVRCFEAEVITYTNKKNKDSSAKWNSRCGEAKHGELIEVPKWKGNSQHYKYREDPVPHIHNYNNYHCPSNGHRAQLAKTEGLRPKSRIASADLWDSKYPHSDRNWKSSFKCKHQWEKHMVRRSKGHNVYVMKEYPLLEEEDILQELMDETYRDMNEEAA